MEGGVGSFLPYIFYFLGRLSGWWGSEGKEGKERRTYVERLYVYIHTYGRMDEAEWGGLGTLARYGMRLSWQGVQRSTATTYGEFSAFRQRACLLAAANTHHQRFWWVEETQ